VVGDTVFDAAIYTSPDAKDDWRKHQLYEDMVEFRKDTFPDDQKEKCIQYLAALGLRYGAFDFIENPDGENIFLECNPNGQFMWLEHKLGLPISNAIASELVKIAKNNP
jgi:glutathione synthase/RimK-type ligase-like ATP-grasp enzyme